MSRLEIVVSVRVVDEEFGTPISENLFSRTPVDATAGNPRYHATEAEQAIYTAARAVLADVARVYGDIRDDRKAVASGAVGAHLSSRPITHD